MIRSAMSGDSSSGGDSINKTIDTLKNMLLPHLKEDTDKKAEKYKKILEKEHNKGALKVKVMEQKTRRGVVRVGGGRK